MASQPKNVFAQVKNTKTLPAQAVGSVFSKPVKTDPTASILVTAAPTTVFGSYTPVLSTKPKELNPTEPKPIFKNATTRTQIVIELPVIKQKFPTLTDEQVNKVSALVRYTVLTNAEQIAEFGINDQKDLSKLLDKELALIQEGSLVEAKTNINQVISTLMGFDIDSSSLKQRVVGLFINKHGQFKSNYSKLEIYITALDKMIPKLRTLRNFIEENANISKVIESNVAISIAAASLLTNYIEKSLTPTLESRINSLVLTQATLESNKLQRKLTIDMIAAIIDNVNSVLLSELPLWKTNVISLLTTKNSLDTCQNILEQRSKMILKLQQ